jgi:hypothetical protein
MLEHKEPARLFGIAQGFILVVVIATAILYRRRQKMLEDDTGAKLDNPNLRSFIKRTGTPPTGAARTESAGDEAKAPAAQLESALPSWTKDTPPHEVLGVRPGATPKEIEAAYKQALKKYHPDRFASWGKGYQTRAHHIVLLLQDARTKLRSGR